MKWASRAESPADEKRFFCVFTVSIVSTVSTEITNGFLW